MFSTVVGLRDRAIIAVMTYTACIGAVVALAVEDYFSQKKRWWLRPHEKSGKISGMPCHHKLEEYLDAHIKAAGIANGRKGPLCRSAIGKTKKPGPGKLSRTDVWRMVRRRASDAGIETAIGCHSFRATGITDYLTNGGRIEVAQRMVGHSNAKTTHRSLRPAQRRHQRRRSREDWDLIEFFQRGGEPNLSTETTIYETPA